MPIPLILGAAALIAGAAGIGLGARGYVKMSEAKDSLEAAKSRNDDNNKRLKDTHKQACEAMDKLGKKEITILASFKDFLDEFEKIKNRPKMEDINFGDVKIPEFNPKEVRHVNQGAIFIAGALSGAALGTAGGFAASGATTAAVMALGTASTGTAISSLTGVAATNATLAALGGGSIAAGGGGMALGSMVLGASSLGVGLLVGGVMFNYAASSLEEKADHAWSEVDKSEKQINKICDYLNELKKTASTYYYAVEGVNTLYKQQFKRMCSIVDVECNWNKLTQDEQLVVDNTVGIVSVLYTMLKVKLVKQSKDENELNQINYADIYPALSQGVDVIKTSGNLHLLDRK